MHISGNDYALLKLVDKVLYTHRTFFAEDDQVALERAKDLVYVADYKKA